MKPHILDTLIADNPWVEGAALDPWYAGHLPPRWIPRRARLAAGEKACLVVGPRQAGKSSLIWKTLSEAGKPALYLNCEEPAIREWLHSPALFLADLAGLAPADALGAVFLEEAQRLPEAGLFLKGIVDRRPGFALFATGSSSFDLESRTRESLAGRADRHLLLPLSLGEMLGEEDEPPLLRDRRAGAFTTAALLHGGYPAAFQAEDPRRVLAGLVESFVVRDASDRFKVEHLAGFRKVLELAASQVGSLCNFSEWAGIAGVSNDTVAHWVFLLEQAHVLRALRPFAGGKRAEITRARKVYFLDNGIRNAVFGGFGDAGGRADRGALLENLVLTELAKNVNPLLHGLAYWRSKAGAEVDFVIEAGGRIAGVEVKAGGRGPHLSRSARSFIQAYSPALFLWVGGEAAADMHEGSTRVRFVRPWEVAAEVRAFGEG